MSCCTPETEIRTDESGRFQLTPEIVCLAIAGFIAGNSTLVAIVANVSEFQVDSAVPFWLQTGLFVATVFVVLLLTPQLWRSVLANLARRRLSVDFLFFLGCLGAGGLSLQAYWTGEGAVYFEVVSILLVLYCLGTYVKGTTQQNVLSQLNAWSPEHHRCLVMTDGKLQSRPVKQVRPGDRVQVAAGSMVPVDGRVVRGQGFLRTSSLTGESHVVAVTVGDAVLASSNLVDAPLTIEASQPGDERLIDQVVRSVENAQRSPSRWETQADQVASWFTPVVAIVALITLFAWVGLADWKTGILNALAVLLVACPCAFGFATPVSIWVALSRLANCNLIVRKNDVIERLAAVDTVVFDKTGTLTAIEPSLINLHMLPGCHWSADQILLWVRSLEAGTQHPIATAFQTEDEVVLPLIDFEMLPGVGVAGTIDASATSYAKAPAKITLAVGRFEPLHQGSGLVTLNDPWQAVRQQCQSKGHRMIAIQVEGKLVAVAEIGDRPVDTMQAGLDAIGSLGLDIKVYSGDLTSRTQQLGVVDATGEMTPEDKLAQLKQLQSDGKIVAFVGDGTNDAGAMSAANASISMKEGSHLAHEASDMIWHGDQLSEIGQAIEICRNSVQKLATTLRFALVYNVVGMTIAALGWLHPVVAVVLMMVSSVTVVTRSTSV